MVIIGVHITKIAAEKKPVSNVTRVGINNNVAVTNVEEKDLALGQQAKQGGLRFAFEFTCTYSPDVGTIHLEGDVLYLIALETAKNIKKEWDEKKKLSPELIEPVLNAALTKCNIEALKISQDINLPSPIPLPKVEKKTVAQKPAAPAKAK